MKLLQRNSEHDALQDDGFHIMGTIMVILLFLTFIGAGFYLFVTNYA